MKSTVGKFLIIQALLTYLIFVTLVDAVYPTVVYEITNLNTEVTTVSYHWTYLLRYVIPIILFILGTYFLYASKKKQRELQFHDLVD